MPLSENALAPKQYLARITTRTGVEFCAVMTAPDLQACFNAARAIWPEAVGLLVEPFTGLPEAPQPEPIAEPEPEPAPESMEEQILGWRERFVALAQEARLQGFTAVVAICGYDPLEDSDRLAYGYSGSYYSAIGALETTLELMLSGDE